MNDYKRCVLSKLCKISKRIGIVCGIMGVMAGVGFAQDPTLTIVEVSYQDQYSSYLNLKWGEEDELITPPHWTLAGEDDPIYIPVDHSIPMTLKFELSFPWDSSSTPVYFRGVGNNGLIIETSGNLLLNETEKIVYGYTYDVAGVMSGMAIDEVEMYFDWEYKIYDGPWLYAGSTFTTCFLLLDYPKEPWGSTPVYVEVLRYATAGMEGATNKSFAMEQLVPALYSFLKYHPGKHYTYPGMVDSFYIREFISDCNYEYQEGPQEGNDCRDFACFYNTLCRAVGIDEAKIMSFSRITFPDDPIITRPVKLAGWIEGARTCFLYHEADYLFQNSTYYAADSSLLLDGNDNDNDGWTSPGILVDLKTYNYYFEHIMHDIPQVLNLENCTLNEGER